MGIPEGEEKEKGIESVFKGIMVKNSMNLGKEMDIQIYEVQKILNRLNLTRATSIHIIIKLSKVKDKKKKSKKQ